MRNLNVYTITGTDTDMGMASAYALKYRLTRMVGVKAFSCGDKMPIKKVGELGEAFCKDCKHYFSLTEKSGACLEKIKLVYPTQRCNKFEAGEKSLDKEKIVELYYKYSEAIKLFNEVKGTLRKIILSSFTNNDIIGDFRILIQSGTQERLNTKKVKDYLNELGILNEYLIKIPYTRLIVKKI